MAGNKFWGGSSSSSSDSEDSSDDEQPTAPVASAPARGRMTRWAEESSSEEEPEQKRTVRSHSDKRFDQMNDAIKGMKNHLKIDDFQALITDYESLLKMLEKMKTLIEQEGGPPKQFIRAAATIADYCEKKHQELLEKKANKGEKLPENKQRAFNTLRAKVRKGNKPHEDLIKEVDLEAEDVDDKKSESSEESDDDKSDDGKKSSSSSGSSSSGSSSSSSSGSDSDSDSDSDSSSSSSGSSSSGSDSDSDSSSSNSYTSGSNTDDGGVLDDEDAREKKMLRWLISPEELALREKKAAEKKKKEEEENKKKEEKRKARGDAGIKEAESRQRERGLSSHKQEGHQDEYSPEELMKKIQEIAKSRGHRSFVRDEFLVKLENLMGHAKKIGPRMQLFIYSRMVAAYFDNTGTLYEAMKIKLWNEALDKVNKMLPLLIESYHENPEEYGKEQAIDQEEEKNDDDEDPTAHHTMQELLVSNFERLDDELYKALQFTVDVYGAEYQEILANSSKFLVLLMRLLHFFSDTKQTHPLAKVSLRLMEQLYYKPDMLNSKVFEAIHFGEQIPEEEKPKWVWPEDSREFMSQLCRNVFAAGTKSREPATGLENKNYFLVRQTRASLCQAFHLALHDHFQAARDLMHLGNLNELAVLTNREVEADVNTKILYNRVIAMLGLCALRLGKIQDAHACLSEVCMHNKARELLAQGLSYSKNMERTPEQERAERLRQLPYHMYINYDVLESAHYICAMLLEVPLLAMQSIDPNSKKVISRVLRRALEAHDKAMFQGPPENAKEAVVCAAKALQRGDWQSACQALEDLKIWDHIDLCHPENGAKVKQMIKEKIKTEALRTYLFAYASIYDAFQLNQLAEMFDLGPKTVHSIISKMMIKEEIAAFWDEASKYVLVQHAEPTPVQRLALTLADRAAMAVDMNERLVDQKTGGYNMKAQGLTQGGGRWDQGGKGGGRYGKGQGNAPNMDDGKGRKGKGRKGNAMTSRPPGNRGWENARAGALRGANQRGWSTGGPTR